MSLARAAILSAGVVSDDLCCRAGASFPGANRTLHMSQTIDFSTPPSLVTLDHKARRVVDPGAEACLRAWQVVWCEASYWRRCEERANAAATAAEARAASDALGGRLERLHASMRAEQTRLREVRYPAAVAAMAAHGGQLERSMSLLWAVDGWGWTACQRCNTESH